MADWGTTESLKRGVGGYARYDRFATSSAAASPSRFETSKRTLSQLVDLSRKRIDRIHAFRPPRGVVLDMERGVRVGSSRWTAQYECPVYVCAVTRRFTFFIVAMNVEKG